LKTKPLIVEYLIIIKQENTFCDSKESFLKFLEVDSSLTISGNQLTINLKKEKLTVSYSITSDLVPSQNQRYFKFTISSEENGKINEFYDLTKLLEEIIIKLHPEVSINMLWNDISRKYAVEGYTLINEVENLLRRLIANFMLTKVGYDYPKYHIPNEVESRDNHLKVNYSDYLHQTYFSDLKTILFEGQREFTHRNIGDIQRIVEKHISEKKKEISIEDLKGVISKSLWEKYFAKETKYKKENLEKDLEELNSLRNEIAHNRHINRDTLGKIKNLSNKIITTLNLAIEDLPNKALTANEQDFQIHAENIRIAELSSFYNNFPYEKLLINWYKINYEITSIEIVNEINKYFDFIIKTADGKTIGIEAKKVSHKMLKYNILEFSKIINSIRFANTIFHFSEFHYVIVLRNFKEDFKDGLINELKILGNQLMSSINIKIPDFKLIIGYFNDEEKFVQLHFHHFIS